MAGHKHAGTKHDDKLCAMTCCPGRIDLKELKPLVRDRSSSAANAGAQQRARSASARRRSCRPARTGASAVVPALRIICAVRLDGGVTPGRAVPMRKLLLATCLCVLIVWPSSLGPRP